MDEQRRVCGVTASMMAQTSAWRKRHLSWNVASEFSGLAHDRVVGVFKDIFGAWESATRRVLTFEEVDTVSAADIMITTGPIDRLFGVLAWSELPPGDDRRLTQRYDSYDKFAIELAPPGNSIGLHETGCHEVGHALGLDHDGANADALMKPTYEPGLWLPKERDIKRIRDLYPDTPPPVDQPDDDKVAAFLVSLNRRGKQLAKFAIKQVA